MLHTDVGARRNVRCTRQRNRARTRTAKHKARSDPSGGSATTTARRGCERAPLSAGKSIRVGGGGGGSGGGGSRGRGRAGPFERCGRRTGEGGLGSKRPCTAVGWTALVVGAREGVIRSVYSLSFFLSFFLSTLPARRPRPVPVHTHPSIYVLLCMRRICMRRPLDILLLLLSFITVVRAHMRHVRVRIRGGLAEGISGVR